MGRDMLGAIAQRKGYVTSEDVKRALQVQQDIRKRGDPHKLLGIIMLELGMLSSTQLLDILQEILSSQNFSTY